MLIWPTCFPTPLAGAVKVKIVQFPWTVAEEALTVETTSVPVLCAGSVTEAAAVPDKMAGMLPKSPHTLSATVSPPDEDTLAGVAVAGGIGKLRSVETTWVRVRVRLRAWNFWVWI